MSNTMEAIHDIQTEGADATLQSTGNTAYELNIPEGMNLNQAELELFDTQAKELNLDNAGAQKLLEISRSNQLKHLDAHNRQVEAWQDEIRKDKDLGGAAFESTVAYAKASLQKFDQSGELLSILEQTGYGNNPHVIRFLSAIGRTHSEDKIILGSPSKTEAPRHERLYGKYNSL